MKDNINLKFLDRFGNNVLSRPLSFVPNFKVGELVHINSISIAPISEGVNKSVNESLICEVLQIEHIFSLTKNTEYTIQVQVKVLDQTD